MFETSFGTTRGSSRDIRLIAFDVDGTPVVHPRQQVVWQLLHERFVGNAQLGWQRYQDYLAGSISYAHWVDLDVGAWYERGVGRAEMAAVIRAELQVVAGGRATLQELRRRGYRLAVISGTLDLVLEELLPDIVFDHVFTNRLIFDQHGALFSWQATPYDIDGKARALEHIASSEGLTLAQCAFVGDHLNDLSVLEIAGLGVAFLPKDPRVAAAADHVIPAGALQQLLPLFPGPGPRGC